MFRKDSIKPILRKAFHGQSTPIPTFGTEALNWIDAKWENANAIKHSLRDERIPRQHSSANLLQSIHSFHSLKMLQNEKQLSIFIIL